MVGEEAGIDDLITVDIGGTSCDIALVHAGKVLSRSAALGERLPGLAAAGAATSAMAEVDDEEAFGDLLVALVAEGRARGFDAETALRVASRRRIATIRRAEGLA